MVRLVRLSVLVSVCWFITTGLGQAQDNPPKHTIVPKIKGIVSINAADLNGDGLKDIVSGSARDGKVAWYKGKEKGYIAQQFLIDEGLISTSHVHVDDLNNDGKGYISFFRKNI